MEAIMNTKLMTSAAALIGTVSFAMSASAQTVAKDEPARVDYPATTLAPATHALELTVGTGYEQAFGQIQQGRPSLTDIGQAGGAVQVGIGARIIPNLTLGLYGSFAGFSRGDQVDTSANLYSAAGGVQMDIHFVPAGSEVDPWLSLGSGWRGYWINQLGGTTSDQGMEIAKLQIGLDYRVAQSVAISPVVGADLSTFFTQQPPGSSGWSNISSPQVNTFLFAGLLGRFDIPTRSSGSQQVASR
jgi:hypothetical protein